jgi:hypothetical protein
MLRHHASRHPGRIAARTAGRPCDFEAIRTRWRLPFELKQRASERLSSLATLGVLRLRGSGSTKGGVGTTGRFIDKTNVMWCMSFLCDASKIQ